MTLQPLSLAILQGGLRVSRVLSYVSVGKLQGGLQRWYKFIVKGYFLCASELCLDCFRALAALKQLLAARIGMAVCYAATFGPCMQM